MTEIGLLFGDHSRTTWVGDHSGRLDSNWLFVYVSQVLVHVLGADQLATHRARLLGPLPLSVLLHHCRRGRLRVLGHYVRLQNELLSLRVSSMTWVLLQLLTLRDMVVFHGDQYGTCLGGGTRARSHWQK